MKKATGQWPFTHEFKNICGFSRSCAAAILDGRMFWGVGSNVQLERLGNHGLATCCCPAGPCQLGETADDHAPTGLVNSTSPGESHAPLASPRTQITLAARARVL